MSLKSHIQTIHLRLWLWFKERAQGPWGQVWLISLAFAETIFVPIPVDPLLIAILLADGRRWVYFATITTLASIVGAIVGYGVGMYAFDALGRPLLALLGIEQGFIAFREVFNQSGFMLMFAAALTPIPNIVIVAGLFGMNFISFLIAWIAGRALRFFGVAYVVYAFGADTLSRIDRWINIGTVIFVLIMIGWFAMSFLHLPVLP